MKTNYLDQDRYKAAQKRVKDIKGFYIHLLVYVLVNIFLIFGNSKTNFFTDLTDLSNYTTALFWGIGLLAHWVGVFGSALVFGKSWEDKKIKELLEREKQEKRKWE